MPSLSEVAAIAGGLLKPVLRLTLPLILSSLTTASNNLASEGRGRRAARSDPLELLLDP